jgi:outer membrane protein assembly factor BamA
MRRTCFLLLSAVVLFFACLPGEAQQFLPKSIQFKGDPEYSDQELLTASGLKLGVALTSNEMKEHAQKLMDSGVFDNLTFKFDGQNLVYVLTPNTSLLPIYLTNLPFTLDSDLNAKLHERFPLYHGKVPGDGGLTDQVRQALEAMLAARGIQAVIVVTPSQDPMTHKVARVSFMITSPPVEIGEIHVDSTSAVLDSKAQEILGKLAGSPYDVEGSPSQIATYLGNYYRDNGYLEASIQAIPQTAPVVTPEAVHIPFVISVSPGALYRLTGVQLGPGLLVTQAEFDHQSNIHPGDIADGQHVVQNWKFISRQYHNKGYMKASVHPTPSFDRTQGTVSFAVSVEPGPAYTMGTLTIANVSDEMRAAMLPAWKMQAGSVFNEGAVLGYFAVGDANPMLKRLFTAVNCKYNLQLNDENHTVDVTLRLEKRH